MKYALLLCLLFTGSIVVRGQDHINLKDYRIKLMDESVSYEMKQQFAKVVRLFSFKNERKETVVRDLYLDGHLRGEAPELNGVPHGRYVGYHKSGHVRDSGSYLNGYREGIWKTFHENGALQRYSIYDEKGRIHGITNEYDSLGGILSEQTYYHGMPTTGVWYHPGTKQVEIIMPYKDGKVHGEYKVFYKNGQLKRYEKYVNDQRIRASCIVYDENGNEVPYRPMVIMSHPEEDVAEYMLSQIKDPEKFLGKDVQGKVRVYVAIDDSNRITETKILEGINKACDNEAIRVVRSMKWKSLIMNDKPRESATIIDVPFYTGKNRKELYKDEQKKKWSEEGLAN